MEVGNTFSLSNDSRKRSNSNLGREAAIHASTMSGISSGNSGTGQGYYGVGSGIGSDAGGGRYPRGMTGPVPNEVGMISRDYAHARR
jgi:hypothetical protein